MTETQITSQLSARVLQLVKWVGVLGGALVGLVAVAFVTGFLAERAQYEFAQVPFVFVDYYAYAETGALGLLDTIYVIASRWWLLLLLVAGSVTLILLLEHPDVHRLSVSSYWLFAACVACLGAETLIIRQQFAVRNVNMRAVPVEAATQPGPTAVGGDRANPPVRATRVATGAGNAAARSGATRAATPLLGPIEDTVPVVAPFSWAVPNPARWKIDTAFIPDTSFEAWRRIADELEYSSRDRRLYVELRPHAEWTSDFGPRSFLGVPVDPSETDRARARRLFELLAVSTCVVIWAVAILSLWDERVLRGLRQVSHSTARREPSVAVRLRDEIWFAAHWVLRPAVILSAIVMMGLLAECYGILAMPRVGHEFVDVVLSASESRPTTTSPAAISAESSTSTAGPAAQSVSDLRDQGVELARTFPMREPEQREALHTQWLHVVEAIELAGDRMAADALAELRDLAAVVAPVLSQEPADAWSRVASKLHLPRSGYILAYPRSETAYLRLIVRKPWSEGVGWSTYPIPMASITEIRVKQDDKVRRVVQVLRRMQQLTPDERGLALMQLERLGFSRMLEIWLAATLDPSPLVKGDAMTNVGRFAAELPSTAAGTFRRQRAAAVLLEVLRDKEVRTDIRGAAATALHYVLGRSASEYCSTLLAALKDPGSDPHWEFRGTVITSLGMMGCQESVPALERLLTGGQVPIEVLATVPSVLVRLTDARAVPSLVNCLRSPATPPEVRRTATVAIGLLSANGLEALPPSLRKEAITALLAEGTRVSGEARRPAIIALSHLGTREAVPLLQLSSLVANEEDPRVRSLALVVLNELSDPTSEDHLISVARDPAETLTNRARAVQALGSFRSASTVKQLRQLYDDVPPRIRGSVLETLRLLAAQGSGEADKVAEELVERERATQELEQLRKEWLSRPTRDAS